MLKIIKLKIVFLFFLLICSNSLQILKADIPGTVNNKVAYYVFDSHGPDHYSLVNFTDEANIVVIFEGTLWELADSIHYSTGWMTTTNPNYRYFSEIIRDIRVLQARGVKVLMNVDDQPSWSTSAPFTTYDSLNLDYRQFAAFIKACAIDSLQLDGISLDIEHRAEGNDNYKTLLKEIGKYFGPLSPDSTTQMYIAAVFKGYWGEPGYEIGRSKDIMAHLNFLMDMAYFNGDYPGRFNQWADSIGSSKVMIGVLNDYFDLNYAVEVAEWQPATGSKAGIMIYAANNLKTYTDSVFRSLAVPATGVKEYPKDGTETPEDFLLMQNYPNPFNPSTKINYKIPENGFVTLKVFDVLGNEISTLVDNVMIPGYYSVIFDGSKFASGLYFARLMVLSENAKPIQKTLKMLMIK